MPPAPEKKNEPTPPTNAAPTGQPVDDEEEEAEEPEEPEEPEEDDPERLAEDAEPYPEKSPEGEIELTDDQLDKQGEIKQQAVDALEDGDLQKALDKYTEVIKIGNATAMLYAKRAEILLKLKRPNACISDCTSAISINPDSGKAYRLRGKAQRKLGRWEEAHQDLSKGQQLDYDDDTVDMQKFVADKFKKINEKRTKARLRDEAKKVKEAKARKEKAKREYEEQKKAEAQGGGYGGGFGGMPGGMGGFPGGMGGFPGGMPGGMGGMPGGLDPSMMAGLLQDPDLLAALQNPKMAGIMQEIMTNPAAMGKYQDDPEVMGLMQKIMGKMGGMGGMGGMGNMFGGMGGAQGSSASSGPTFEEVPETTTGVEEID